MHLFATLSFMLVVKQSKQINAFEISPTPQVYIYIYIYIYIYVYMYIYIYIYIYIYTHTVKNVKIQHRLFMSSAFQIFKPNWQVHVKTSFPLRHADFYCFFFFFFFFFTVWCTHRDVVFEELDSMSIQANSLHTQLFRAL